MSSKSRQHQLEMQHLEDLRRMRDDARRLDEDVFVRGIGRRRLQLIHEPSFVVGYAWDIRQTAKAWHLYRSTIRIEGSHAHLFGYDRLVADAGELNSWFTKACKLSVPFAPDLSDCAGCDGETFQLAIFGDLSSVISIKYWCDAPEQWKSIQHFIDAFRNYASKCIIDEDFPDCMI